MSLDLVTQLAARSCAESATMLDSVEDEAWRRHGLCKGQARLVSAYSTTLLRINAIEFGLKHIIANEIGSQVPRTHNLIELWEKLTDGWKQTVSKDSGVSLTDIHEHLDSYKDANIPMRYGGSFGSRGPQRGAVMKKLADALGKRACPEIPLPNQPPQLGNTNAGSAITVE